MKIKETKFIKSVFIDDNEAIFDNRWEIVFVWRSNVGKSSIMNALMHKKDLVKTSSKPGKTKTANIFLVNNKYYFTDLPGYWFAKLWKNILEKLDALISWYLEARIENIKKIVMLIDTKIWPQQADIDMYKFILNLWIPIVIVLSKIDRLSKNEIHKSKKLASDIFFWQDIFPISSTKNIWIRELEKYLGDALETK